MKKYFKKQTKRHAVILNEVLDRLYELENKETPQAYVKRKSIKILQTIAYLITGSFFISGIVFFIKEVLK